MAFALAATALIGMLTLGTEVGLWYLELTTARNAASAAAIAGALAASHAIATGTDPESVAKTAAISVATLNGYTSGSAVAVTANYPPTSGSHAGTAGAIEITTNSEVTPLLASLFTGDTVNVPGRAVGLVTSIGPACALATATIANSALQIGQNQATSTCTYASNDTGAEAVKITAGSVAAYGITATGGCSTCSATSLLRPLALFQPPTTDPYKTQTATLALPTTYQTIDTPTATTYALVPGKANGTYTGNNQTFAWESGTDFYAYKSNLTIGSGRVVDVAPGTYYFYNASLTISGGATLRCRVGTVACAPGSQGVTIILTGSPASSIGRLNIASGATVSLGAPRTNDTYAPQLNGILFYRAGPPGSEGTDSATGAAASITVAGASSALAGGLYFPNAFVYYGGNSLSTCSILVGGYLRMSNGNGTTIMQYNGCTAIYNTPLPQVQAARLVE